MIARAGLVGRSYGIQVHIYSGRRLPKSARPEKKVLLSKYNLRSIILSLAVPHFVVCDIVDPDLPPNLPVFIT